ncbi:MAG TPA: MFS transporter [Stellaceae bacterium]|jgi:DHA1 family tetracycline resistance protein-like MFS transporter
MPILFLIVFIDLLGFGLVIPLLPFYALDFGAGTTAVIWLLGAFSLAQLISSPLLGHLSDRIGRKPVLLLGLGCSVISYVWMGFADQLWMLFAARFFAGAGAGTIGAVFAYVTDSTTVDKRAKGMGIIGAGFGLGFTLGPALSLVISSHPTGRELAIPLFIAAGLSALAFILALFLLKESLPPESRHAPVGPGRIAFARRIVSHRPTLFRLIAIAFIVTGAFATMESSFTLWSREKLGWGPHEVAIMFIFVGALLSIVQGTLMGRLTRQFGETRLLVAASILLFFGLLGVPLVWGLPPLVLVNIALAGGMALFGPSSNSLISREAAIDERGGVLGVSQSAQSLARVVGPLIAGPLFAVFGRNAPFWAASAAMAIAVVLAFGLLRRVPAEVEAS